MKRAADMAEHNEQQGECADGEGEHPQPARCAGIGWPISHAGSLANVRCGRWVRYETKRPEFVNQQSGTNARYRTLRPVCPENGVSMAKKQIGRQIDRRVSRSRNLLQQAHMSLILKKDYEAITVDEICEAANVGRSTFYAHYAGKDDLRRSGLEHLRRQLVARQAEVRCAPDVRDRSLGFSLAMFEHARDHLDLYRALAGGRGGAVALGAISQILSDLIRSELALTTDAKSADHVPRDVVVQYVVGAFMAVMTWWLDGGAKLPPQRVDAMFRQLACDGILQAYA